MYTPSAYTLTNTTRPHELNAKDRVADSPNKRRHGEIGILAKEQTVHNAQRQNHRQSHAKEDHQAPRNSPRRGDREDRISSRGRFAISRSRYTVESKLPWFSSVQPRALTHSSYTRRARRSSTSVSYTLALSACTYTYTLTHELHTRLHSVTLDYTRLHTLRICKANWFCKLSMKTKNWSKERTFKSQKNDSASHGTFSLSVCRVKDTSRKVKEKRLLPIRLKRSARGSSPIRLASRQARTNRIERQWTRIYGQYEKQLIRKRNRKTKMKNSGIQKTENTMQNSRPLAYVWMQNRWWNGVRVSTRSSPCIPDLTPRYPNTTRRSSSPRIVENIARAGKPLEANHRHTLAPTPTRPKTNDQNGAKTIARPTAKAGRRKRTKRVVMPRSLDDLESRERRDACPAPSNQLT